MRSIYGILDLGTITRTLGPFTYAYNRIFSGIGIKVTHDFVTDRLSLVVPLFRHRLILSLPGSVKERRLFISEYGIQLHDRGILSFLWDRRKYSISLPFLYWDLIARRCIDTQGNVYRDPTTNLKLELHTFLKEDDDLPSIYFTVIMYWEKEVIRAIVYDEVFRYGRGWFSRFANIIGNRNVRYLGFYRMDHRDQTWNRFLSTKVLPNDDYDEIVRRLCATNRYWKFIGRCDQETVQ